MGIKNLIKKYRAYESDVISKRVSAYKKKGLERRAYKTEFKKELEEARRKSYRAEALRQASAAAKLQAQRRYNMWGVRQPTVKTKPKPVNRKKKKAKRRTVVKYVYR